MCEELFFVGKANVPALSLHKPYCLRVLNGGSIEDLHVQHTLRPPHISLVLETAELRAR